jgi:N-acetylmuramoyl-L-alanine amidase
MTVKTFRLPRKKNLLIIALVACLALTGIYFGYSKVKSGSEARMALTNEEKELIFVLDAGHGGMDGGCSSADGVPEKGINLNIMLTLRDMLVAEGYKVEVTRDKDISTHDKGVTGIANQKSSDMDNRLAKFNKYDNAVCVSIHQNNFTDPKYSGAQIFYSDTNSKSEGLAQIIQSQMVEFLQPDNKREIKLSGKELFLCYYSKNPTVMVECGFLSNPEEANRLKTEEYQKELAFTIFTALNKYVSENAGGIPNLNSAGEVDTSNAGGDVAPTNTGGDVSPTNAGGDVAPTNAGGKVASTNADLVADKGKK